MFLNGLVMADSPYYGADPQVRQLLEAIDGRRIRAA